MDWNNVVLPLSGVVVGWLLTELSAHHTAKRQWNQRLRELRIEAYAEWAAGMESHLVNYAQQRVEGGSDYRVPLLEKRLLLIDYDSETQELIKQVRNSLPDSGSNDYEELRMISHSDGEWDWPPFRTAMNALFAHVQKRLA